MRQMSRTGYFNGDLSTKLHIIKRNNKNTRQEMNNLQNRIFYIQSQDV